jgi:hypothetical protein
VLRLVRLLHMLPLLLCCALQYQYFQNNNDVAVFRVGPLSLDSSSANDVVSSSAGNNHNGTCSGRVSLC